MVRVVVDLVPTPVSPAMSDCLDEETLLSLIVLFR